MKPVILISHKPVVTEDFGIGKEYIAHSNYCRAIIKAGGIPIISADGDAEAYAEICDGLLLTGGGNDIEPHRYGEENRHALNCDSSVDDMEFSLFNAFLKRKKPILGICRGIQVINVALGGTLCQHIKDEHSPLLAHGKIIDGGPKEHPVKAAPESLFARLFGEEFLTNSYHHQAVKTCGKGLLAAVVTDGNLIEGIEHESLPIFGVQWHPERMIGEEALHQENMLPLFRHFTDCCKK